MEESNYLQREKEYTVQHFGFDPANLVKEITEDSLETLGNSLGAIKMQIRTKKSGKYKEDELDKGMAALEKKYTEYIEKKFECAAAHLDAKIFKIPPHVLLKGDTAWDSLTHLVAKTQWVAVNTEMEKMREKYKTCVFKKTYLRSYLDKLKSICTYQEEAIQKEVDMKEKCGLAEGVEVVDFCGSHADKLAAKLNSLHTMKKALKRKAGEDDVFRSKKMKLDLDMKHKVDLEIQKQVECLASGIMS